jgi:NCS1 family nucleobase:cation symporter-1
LVIGVTAATIGNWVPSLQFIYDYSWFVGFFLAGTVYAALTYLSPVTISEPADA